MRSLSSTASLNTPMTEKPAAFAVLAFGNWQYLFPIFAGITFLSALWLQVTPIDEGSVIGKASTFGETFALLKNRTILLLFLGIVFIVGTDVGMNTVAPKLLIERCGFAVQDCRSFDRVGFVGAAVGYRLLPDQYLAGVCRYDRTFFYGGNGGNPVACRSDWICLLEHFSGSLFGCPAHSP